MASNNLDSKTHPSKIQNHQDRSCVLTQANKLANRFVYSECPKDYIQRVSIQLPEGHITFKAVAFSLGLARPITTLQLIILSNL